MHPFRLIVFLASVGLPAAAPAGVDPAVPSPALPLENFGMPGPWQTDYAAALKQAAAEKKTVLLNFTGSDWCVWCHRLRDEVFQQKPFLDYARAHLILVELDFPRTKRQPEQEKQQNAGLAQTFAVTGYPTLILVDADGHELGRTGYMQGGPKTFVRELKRLGATAAAPKPAP